MGRSFMQVAYEQRSEIGDSLVVLTQSVAFQNYSCLSALILLVWEYVDTLGSEVKFIWGQRLTPVKLAFLFARYYGLASQIANYAISVTQISALPVSTEVCRAWYGFQVVSFWTLYVASDLILMMRVYALYHRSHRIGMGLLFLHAVEGFVVTISAWHTLEVIQFDSTCIANHLPPDVFVFAVTIFVTQSAIWLLTYLRRHAGEGETVPVVATVVRDGKWVWIIVCVVLLIEVSVALSQQVARPHLVFSWPITLLSIGACRLIINMNKTAVVVETKRASRDFVPIGSFDAHQHNESSSNYRLSDSTERSSVPTTALTYPISDDNSSTHSFTAGASDYYRSRSPGRTSRQSSQKARSTFEGSTGTIDDHVMPAMELDDDSANIEIGSLQRSSTGMNSDEWRGYWNELL